MDLLPCDAVFVSGLFFLLRLGCGVVEIEAVEEKGRSEGFVSEDLRNIVSSEKDASDEYWICCLYALTLKWCGEFGKCVARVNYYTE